MDVFLASVACGAEQIRIEKKTALCIGAVCSGVLFFSLVCGKLIDGVVREKYAAYLCFAGLFLVGAYKLGVYQETPFPVQAGKNEIFTAEFYHQHLQ